MEKDLKNIGKSAPKEKAATAANNIKDKVTLIGDNIPIKEVARHNGTSIYETMCNIGKNIPRVYKKNNEVIGIEEGK